MSDITTTRVQVRRALGRAMHMEYYLRYGDDIQIVTAGSTTTPSVTSSNLNQDTDFWAGGWIYLNEEDEERMIIASSSNGLITLDYPQTNASTSGDLIEITDGWPPHALHDAGNRAIRHAWRFWPDIVEADLVLTERLDYAIASSDFNDNGDPGDNDFFTVAEVLQIWLEVNESHQGQITSTSSVTAFNDTASEWSTNSEGEVVDTDWLVSIYEGPGAGQLRQLNTWDSNGLFTVDTDWTRAPDTNSKWKAWNPSTDEAHEWYRVFAARFDELENPNRVNLVHRYPGAYGMRLRFKYVAQSSDFAADTDVSRVPLEYITYKSMSFLYAEMVSDNQHDRASNAGQAEYYGQLADDLSHKDMPYQPAGTLWQETDPVGYAAGDDVNPLDW